MKDPETRHGFAAGLLILVAACAPAFEHAPWLLPVPEGTATIGLEAVANAGRALEPPIEMVPELLIGGGDGDFNHLFGSVPPRVAVGVDGRIAVLDGGNHRVQVFDDDGAFLATIGREGQGPGELRQPLALLAEGDALLVYDVVNRRVTRWSWDGELLAASQTELWGSLIAQPGGGELLWRATERHPDGTTTVFQRVAANGAVLVEYARMPWPERVIDPPIGEIVATEPDAWWVGTVPPAFAATADGEVIVSPLSEYQRRLFAYAVDGTMKWALQTDVPRASRAPCSQRSSRATTVPCSRSHGRRRAAISSGA